MFPRCKQQSRAKISSSPKNHDPFSRWITVFVCDTGNDVFRRHENCRCTVEYVCDGTRQDVWSKKFYTADAETLQARENYHTSTGDTSPETLQKRSEYGREPEQKETPNKGVANGDNSGIITSEKGSALFSLEAKKRLYQHERIISGNKYETAIIYDSEGNVVFRKKGTKDRVSFTKAEARRMNGCVFTHNHPGSFGFSPDDINLMRQTNLSEIRACTTRGTYSLVLDGKKWPPELWDLEAIEAKLNTVKEATYDEYEKKAKEDGVPFIYRVHKADQETYKRFAEKYGLVFRFEELESG